MLNNTFDPDPIVGEREMLGGERKTPSNLASKLRHFLNWKTEEVLSRTALFVAFAALLLFLGSPSLLAPVFAKLGYAVSSKALLGMQILFLIVPALAMQQVLFIVARKALDAIENRRKKSVSLNSAEEDVSSFSQQEKLTTVTNNLTASLDTDLNDSALLSNVMAPNAAPILIASANSQASGAGTDIELSSDSSSEFVQPFSSLEANKNNDTQNKTLRTSPRLANK